VVPVYCDRHNDITVRDLHVTGAPRYGIWFKGSSNVTLNNITMDLSHPGTVGQSTSVGMQGSAGSVTCN
jgi:hypothetical protein